MPPILETLGLSPSSKAVYYIKIFGKKGSTIKPRSTSVGKMCGKGRDLQANPLLTRSSIPSTNALTIVQLPDELKYNQLKSQEGFHAHSA